MTTAHFGPGSLEGGVLLTIHRLSQGGADRVTVLLANGFIAAGMTVGVVILRTGGEAETELLGMLHPDVRVSHAGLPMGSRHLELVRGYRYIRRQIVCARPALVFASSSNMGLVTGLCARASGTARPRFLMKLTNPVIRPRDEGTVKTTYRRWLYQFIFGSFDTVLVLSEAEQHRLARMFPSTANRFMVVANPYVTPDMLVDVERQPWPENPIIIALARMMPQKRLDRLLAAFALSKNPAASLLILGDGPERVRLEEQIRSLGLDDRVDMPGFTSNVVSLLRQASLFVLSSDYEGLPAAIFEALACNVPVITTDCFDGARDLLAGAPGCAVVAREDVEAFAAAIDRSLEMDIGGADLRNIARPYSFKVAIDAHVDAVRSLLAAADPLWIDGN
jgi:glycosyltransferase involved in cell wall biosynthesis